MKKILIIASCDTKIEEANYAKNIIKSHGHECLILDITTGYSKPTGYDISRDKALEKEGYTWEQFKILTKGEKIGIMTDGTAKVTKELYEKGMFDGIFSLGGVQNSTVAVAAMKQLPIGVPKVVVSTVASGNRTFGPYVGSKDIVLIPSIADIAGINTVTSNVIGNGVAALVGMVEHAGNILKRTKKVLVGTTLMGVTNTGVCSAIERLKQLDVEAVGFHSTGVGGNTMESLISQGILNAVMDLTLHEITSDYFGGGFSYGAKNRLSYLEEFDIPTVISLGGLDFVDYAVDDFPGDLSKRKYIKHNAQLAHIKIFPQEATEVAKIVLELLNRAKGNIVLLVPTKGLRCDTQKGEKLYDPEVDQIIIDLITQNVNPNIEVKYIEANLNDKEFGYRAAEEMYNLLKVRGDMNE